MPFITESELRSQLRPPRKGAQVVVPENSKLSLGASDFVKQWDLQVITASGAAATSNTSSPGQTAAGLTDTGAASPQAGWNKESVFPVNFEGERPRCICCGTQVETKASGLTQLNAYHFAPKTHPRIKLRGQLDSLHAMVLLVQRMAKEAGEQQLTDALGTLAAYCRELTSAEYNERPVEPLAIGEWDVEAIHRATHDPQGVLGVAHLTIDDSDDLLQHWLNMARTRSREIEILAMEVFESPHHPYGAAICAALNRLSSACYFLQLQLKAGWRSK